MAIDLNNLLANVLLEAYAAEFPAGSIVQIRTGAGAGVENAANGSLLCEITTPATPWAAAGSGSLAKNNTWSGTATGAGTAGHYRLKNAGDTRREEGSIGEGSGDMSLDNTDIAVGQVVTISTFTRTL